MTTAKPQLQTADDLLRLDSQGVRGEPLRRVLYDTMPTERQHGRILINLGTELRNFTKPRAIGSVEGEDVGGWLERDPDTIRAPDIAFFSSLPRAGQG